MKMFFRGMQKFLASPWFALVVYGGGYYVWFAPVDLTLFLIGYGLLVVLVLRVSQDLTPFFPLIMSLLFLNVIGAGDTSSVPTMVSSLPLLFLAIMVGVVVLCLGWFAWRHRLPKTYFGSWWERHIGMFGLGLLAISLAYALAKVRMEGHAAIDFPYVDTLLIVLLWLIYRMFRRTQGEHVTRAFVQSAMHLGTLMAAQLLTDYALRFELVGASTFTPNVGWGISNQVAIMLLFLLPFSAYHAIRYPKTRGLALLYVVIQSLALVLTLSRGGIGAWALMMIGVFVLWWRAERHHPTFWFAGMLFAAALAGMMVVAPNILQYVWEHLLVEGISDSGRLTLYASAWQHFLQSPLTGIGTVLSPTVFDPTPWFHSTLLDTLASLGLVGVAAFGIHFYEKYHFFVTQRDDFKRFALLALLGSGLYGMIDISYYHFSYFLLLVFLLAVAEQREWLQRG